MFVSAIKGLFGKKQRSNAEGEENVPVTTQPGLKEEQESESSQSSTVVSSASTVLSTESLESRVTVFFPEDNEEVQPEARLPPFIQAYTYGSNEYPPSLSGVASDLSTVSQSSADNSAQSEMSEYEDEEKENRAEDRVTEEQEGEQKVNQLAQGDFSLDEILDDSRPLFSDVEEEDDLSRAHQSHSKTTLDGSEKDHFGYEFERLSEADFNSLARRKESLRSVGIDYTPSGGGHTYKRDSYVAAPPPPAHNRPLDGHSSHHSSSQNSPVKPVPIDGVIGSAGYHRSRVQLRDSASASPHSFTNRRSLQQLNNSAVYANLGGSFHEFPLATSGGSEQRRPPIPQRSSIVSESTVSSTASPVVMRQHPQQYNTPVSARRGLELHNGYGGSGGSGGRENGTRFSVAAPTYYDEQHYHQPRLHPSSHRSSKTHRSSGIAVTSASGRGMVTSISHHDGYPNGGYTMEEYGEEHSGGSSAASSFERDQHVRSLENRLREVEQLLASQQQQTAATTATPTFARSARHHAQSTSSQSRAPPTSIDVSVLAEREAEINNLQKCLESQRLKYEEELRTLRANTEVVSGEHSVFNNKLSRMERELEEYKEKAARADPTAIAAAASKKLEEKETELSNIRNELDRMKRDKEKMEKRQEQIEFLEKQNESLMEQVGEKEGAMKALEAELVTIRLEQQMCQQSCSSGSTPLADEETRSLDVSRTPQNAAHPHHHGDSASVGGGGQLARVRQYTKAHSTLGASGIAITPSSSSNSPSLQGTPKSGGLAKSLSNYHLDGAGTGRNELSPSLSVMIRKNQKLSVDSRALAHCIRECAEKTMRGEQPDTNLLVGRMTGESMSDSSDCEMVATDCTKMSHDTAEKTLRQQEVTLSKVHSSLEAMRGLLLQVYQRQFHDEMERGDESCRVQ